MVAMVADYMAGIVSILSTALSRPALNDTEGLMLMVGPYSHLQHSYAIGVALNREIVGEKLSTERKVLPTEPCYPWFSGNQAT